MKVVFHVYIPHSSDKTSVKPPQRVAKKMFTSLIVQIKLHIGFPNKEKFIKFTSLIVQIKRIASRVQSLLFSLFTSLIVQIKQKHKLLYLP